MCFAEFPEQILEPRLSLLITVRHQEDAVVAELAGKAGEFFELFSGDFVAAEADSGYLEFVKSHDVVHAFDDDEAVAIKGFFDPGFLQSSGVAAVEFEAAMIAADVTVLAWLFTFWFTVANPVVPFRFEVQIAAAVADDFPAFIAVRVDEIVLSKHAAAVAGDPASSPFLE